jgi:aminopeptidase YwaD
LEKPQWVTAGQAGAAACTGDGCLIFRRKPTPKGPLAVFGYDYFADRFKGTPKLLNEEGPRHPASHGSGEEAAFEILNFANGRRNAQAICDAVSAEYGPVALDVVVEYLRALEKIGVVEKL